MVRTAGSQRVPRLLRACGSLSAISCAPRADSARRCGCLETVYRLVATSGRGSPREDPALPADPGRASRERVRALLTQRALAGGSSRRQLRALRPSVSRRSVRPPTGKTVAPVCRRRCAICPEPSPAPAFEARETPDDRAAILPALRTLSWGRRL